MTIADLNKCQSVGVSSVDSSLLMDLREVSIDKTLDLEKRVDSLIKQVRNPYLFKVGDVIVKVSFTGSKPLSDSLANVFSS